MSVCVIFFIFKLYRDNTPLADPHYLNHPNYSWPLDHLVVFLISGQGYFTFLYRPTTYTTERVKEKKNKQSQAWVSSKHKKGEVCDTFLAFCASVS